MLVTVSVKLLIPIYSDFLIFVNDHLFTAAVKEEYDPVGVDFDPRLDYGIKANLPADHRTEHQTEIPCLQRKDYLICAVSLAFI